MDRHAVEGAATDAAHEARHDAVRYLEQRAGLGEPLIVGEWQAPPPRPPAVDRETPEILAALQALAAAVATCTRCPLHATRTRPVFGVGSCRSGILFVGEGPGEQEDLRGEPFVGRAGELLTRAITQGMKLTRDDVYIANIVKSRPPNNRVPTVEEAEACMPYLTQQIALLRPAVICALGLTAATWLLLPKGTKTPLGKLRGQEHVFHGIPVVVTYHPAAILRNPGFKRPFWEDLQTVMARAGLPVPTAEAGATAS